MQYSHEWNHNAIGHWPSAVGCNTPKMACTSRYQQNKGAGQEGAYRTGYCHSQNYTLRFSSVKVLHRQASLLLHIPLQQLRQQFDDKASMETCSNSLMQCFPIKQWSCLANAISLVKLAAYHQLYQPANCRWVIVTILCQVYGERKWLTTMRQRL